MIITGFISNAKGSRQAVRAFALVSVLAILTLLMVLVLSISAVIHTETRSSASSKNQLIARQNALLGLDTAMGQLQEYAGKDQAVTFPATTFYPTKDMNLPTASSPRQGKGDLFDNATYGYRTKAVTSKSRSYLDKVGTYLTPAERTAWDTALRTYWNENRNPRWTGIMDASLRVDSATNPNANPTALPAQSYESNPATKFGEPKRDQLPVWLVSGNEKFEIDQNSDTVYPPGYQTPDTALPDPAADSSIVYLVGTGSATDNSTSSDGLDGRVKAKKQAVIAKDPTGADKTTGYYAYWVGDESTKANFGARDRTSTDDSTYPDDVAKTSTTYRNRLQSPQRIGWQNLTGFSNATFGINDQHLENISTSQEIGLIEPDDSKVAAIKAAAKNNFHSLTAFSKSLLTDTALGGLKKDLTAFLERGQGPGVSSTIADASLYNNTDARFKAWNGTNTGFPASSDGLPTWGQIKSWYQNESSGSGSAINPDQSTAPVISYISLFFGFSYDPATRQIRMHWMPQIVLWNPYDVPLGSADYDIDIGVSPDFYSFYVASPAVKASQVTLVDADANGKADTDSDGIFRGNQAPTGADTKDFFYETLVVPNGWNDGGGSTPPYFDQRSSQTVAPTVNDTNSSTVQRAWNPMRDKATSTSNDLVTKKTTSTYVAIDATMKFRITSGFSAGESKIFTLGSDPGDTVSNWNPSQRLSLKNFLELNGPASAWYPVMTITANAPAADNSSPDGLDPTKKLKWISSMAAQSFDSPYVRFSFAGSGTPISESFDFGSLQFDHIDVGIKGKPWPGKGPTDPVADWLRPIPSTDKFSDNINIIQSATLGAAIPYGRCWLEPFTSDGGEYLSSVDDFQPGLSRFNLTRSMDKHPLVDAQRDRYDDNNTDWMGGRLNVKGAAGAEQNPPSWDEEQSNGTDAFSLIAFQSKPGAPYKGLSILPIRNAKRASSEILSLGQFQQVNLSPYNWQPAFPIGNSDASPYTDREAIAGIHSRPMGGKNTAAIGRIPNTGSLPPGNTTNRYGAAVPGNSMIDMSYLLNENLWDRYFLSTIKGTPDTTKPLPNSRMRFTPDASTASTGVLQNFDTASAYLENTGALNVNSTSVEAWKALLTAFRGLSLGSTPETPNVPIARTLDPIGGSVQFTSTSQSNAYTGIGAATGKDYSGIVSGFRYLTDAMIQTLAERIVDEVRLRGPFLSLSDFVNRRLVAPQGSNDSGSDWYVARTDGLVGANTDSNNDFVKKSYDPFIGLQGINGALQRAINVSGINGGVNHPALGADGNNAGLSEDRVYSVRIRNAGDSDNDANGALTFTTAGIGKAANSSAKHSIEPAMRHYLDTEHYAGAPVGEAGQYFQGTPGFVTQGDLLAMIGPALTPRGDTFLVRTYGDAVDKNGKVLARSYLEAVVQRMPEPVTAAGTTGTDKWRPTDKFGRKFQIVKLRWLNPEEI